MVEFYKEEIHNLC